MVLSCLVNLPKNIYRGRWINLSINTAAADPSVWGLSGGQCCWKQSLSLRTRNRNLTVNTTINVSGGDGTEGPKAGGVGVAVGLTVAWTISMNRAWKSQKHSFRELRAVVHSVDVEEKAMQPTALPMGMRFYRTSTGRSGGGGGDLYPGGAGGDGRLLPMGMVC